MSHLVCRGLTRRPWFSNVDLELVAGEICVLRGPSGAGKSLLLRTIADLDPADSGEVALEGRPSHGYAAHEWRRRVLYVHPGGVRWPGTVADNLERVTCLGSVDCEREVTPVAELPLDLGADAERLSSGEANWLALARALSIQPNVLLLDETTSALDPESARRAEARVAAFARGTSASAGRSVLWISHDPDLAERLAARTLQWEELTGAAAQ